MKKRSIIGKLILFRKWLVSEFGMVILHEIVIFAIIFPIVIVVLFSEALYSQFSLADPS